MCEQNGKRSRAGTRNFVQVPEGAHFNTNRRQVADYRLRGSSELRNTLRPQGLHSFNFGTILRVFAK
jgi:hypothetical protein